VDREQQQGCEPGEREVADAHRDQRVDAERPSGRVQRRAGHGRELRLVVEEVAVRHRAVGHTRGEVDVVTDVGDDRPFRHVEAQQVHQREQGREQQAAMLERQRNNP